MIMKKNVDFFIYISKPSLRNHIVQYVSKTHGSQSSTECTSICVTS